MSDRDIEPRDPDMKSPNASTKLSAIDYWRLCDDMSIVQAALLLIGRDPSDESAVEEWQIWERPSGYEAAKTAIRNAVLKGKIEAMVIPSTRQVVYHHGFDKEVETEKVDGTVDVQLTQVSVESLRAWLADRGVTTGFFMQGGHSGPGYLDPNHPRYAPKLAAAVRAWIEVEDPQGKSPKAALIKWLREHAREFGLSDDEGKPNEQGIDDCAKVANWQPGGGAPKTPGA